MRVHELFSWVKERHSIYLKKVAGQPKPWTDDPILQNYRFCNPYRENDTVTQWIKENWRDPHTNDPNVWFAMAVARYVNWPETLAEVGYPVPWNEARFENIVELRRRTGEKVWTGAYMIHAGKGGSKIEHIAREILTPLWERRDYVREARSCAHLQKRLMEFNGIGSFMAGQIVCDTKYTRLLEKACDWWTFACPGPGSRRGLARVYGKPVGYNWKDFEWTSALFALHDAVEPLVKAAGMPRLHAQDLQNCLCEFDKYERVRLGEGRPRSGYPGAK